MKAVLPLFRPEDLVPTRYSLLSRLQNRDDQEGWKTFFDTYWRLVYSAAIRSGLNETEAQEVVQETIICVARDIDKFRRDRALGSFKGWLRNIIRWRVADQFRKRNTGRHADDPGGEAVNLEEIAQPDEQGFESVWDREWQSNLFEAAVDRVKRRVKEEQYQIFDLYVVKGWPVLKVARAMRVNPGKVYLIKHRVASLIRKEIAVLEQKLI